MLVQGSGASFGVGTGTVRVITNSSQLSAVQEGEIVVTTMTDPAFVPVFKKIVGLVTDLGGATCHAAIISREFNLPCVVGTGMATSTLVTGNAGHGRWGQWISLLREGSVIMIEIQQIDMPLDYEQSVLKWQEFCQIKMSLQGYVCLAVLPGEEGYTGLVQNSFSLGNSLGETQFFWTGTAHSFLGKNELDGWALAKARADKFEQAYPGSRVFIFDARDSEQLPVTLNWEKWVLDFRPRGHGVFGVHSKYGARNISFQVDSTKPFVH